jgi:hypothetical protein
MQPANDANSVQLTQMISKFGNIENWKEVMESNGFVIIDCQFLTWYYVAQVMSGQKSLIKQNQLVNFFVPPR